MVDDSIRIGIQMNTLVASSRQGSKMSLEEALRRVATIDLSMVKMKIMDPEEGKGWEPEYADAVETKYRRYLAMYLMFPERKIVPNKEVDVFWHQHILDTRAYAKDCDTVFGHFLHHFPYFGMRGEKDAQNLQSCFTATCNLYAELFDEAYVPEFATEAQSCGTGACAKCGSEHCSS